MSEPVIIAIVGASGTVLAAIFGAWITSRRQHPGVVPVPNAPKTDTKPSPVDSSPVSPVSVTAGTNTLPNLVNPVVPNLEILGGHESDGEQSSSDGPITKDKGSYVLWLGPPLVPSPRFVHFSWGGRAGPQSFKVRDYIARKLLQHRGATPQPEDKFQIGVCSMTRDEVWDAAQVRIPARGELFHSVPDFAWWEQKLADMTRNRVKV